MRSIPPGANCSLENRRGAEPEVLRLVDSHVDQIHIRALELVEPLGKFCLHVGGPGLGCQIGEHIDFAAVIWFALEPAARRRAAHRPTAERRSCDSRRSTRSSAADRSKSWPRSRPARSTIVTGASAGSWPSSHRASSLARSNRDSFACWYSIRRELSNTNTLATGAASLPAAPAPRSVGRASANANSAMTAQRSASSSQCRNRSRC